MKPVKILARKFHAAMVRRKAKDIVRGVRGFSAEKLKKYSLLALIPLTFFSLADTAGAHGVVGQRFIPSTLTLEDPFPSDELDLVTFSRGSKNKEGRESSVGFEFGKRLTPDLAIGIGWEYLFGHPRESGEPNVRGAGNPEFSLKYALVRSAPHEGILSIGVEFEPGGVGSRMVAERATTISPALYFGKGFGDLPDALKYLKPLAVTGSVDVGIPANRKLAGEEERISTTVGYGIAVLYSFPYLQSFVKDIGLPAPLDRMFPVTEFSFTTNVNRPYRGSTTSFFNPGVIWAGKYVQLGVEAQVPMTPVSGRDVGVKTQMHLFIDDIWPGIFTWTPFGTIGATQK